MQTPPPVTHYFIHDGKRQYGPFTYGQLCTMRIYRNALIWREGLPAWTNAGDLPDLQAFPFATYPQKNNNESFHNSSGWFSLLVETFSPIGCLLLAVMLLFIICFALVVLHDFSTVKPKKKMAANVIYFESAENHFTRNTVR